MGRLITIAILGMAIVAAPASATLTIYDSDMNELATIDKAQCKLRKAAGPTKSRFIAFSLPKEANWTVAVFIPNNTWHGFGFSYPLFYGADPTAYAFSKSPAASYSNAYPIPGTPPGIVGGGAINFSPKGKAISVGLDPAPNADYTSGVIFAGSMKCKYPKRR
jgi:hypothetical protein